MSLAKDISINEPTQYLDLIKSRILSVLSESPVDFIDLLKSLRGVYPGLVRTEIDNLIQANEVFYAQGRFYANTEYYSRIDKESFDWRFISSVSKQENADDIWTVQTHPGDYDWRFSTSTISELTYSFKQTFNKEDTIGLFGVESLYIPFSNYFNECYLFNNSKVILEQLNSTGYSNGLIHHDLFDQFRFERKFSVIVADPPWYLPFYRAFIFSASKALKIGGKLFLSLIPEMTRPDALLDRKKVIEYSESCGFKMRSCLQDELLYRVPPFERIELEKSNLFIGEWRTSDLVELDKIADADLSVPENPSDEANWHDLVVGGILIKIRKRKYVANLNSILTFDYANLQEPYFGTISRRSPYRDRIDIWTSDNMAFSTSNPRIIQKILQDFKELSDFSMSLDSYNFDSEAKRKIVSFLKHIETKL